MKRAELSPRNTESNNEFIYHLIQSLEPSIKDITFLSIILESVEISLGSILYKHISLDKHAKSITINSDLGSVFSSEDISNLLETIDRNLSLYVQKGAIREEVFRSFKSTKRNMLQDFLSGNLSWAIMENLPKCVGTYNKAHKSKNDSDIHTFISYHFFKSEDFKAILRGLCICVLSPSIPILNLSILLKYKKFEDGLENQDFKRTTVEMLADVIGDNPYLSEAGIRFLAARLFEKHKYLFCCEYFRAGKFVSVIKSLLRTLAQINKTYEKEILESAAKGMNKKLNTKIAFEISTRSFSCQHSSSITFIEAIKSMCSELQDINKAYEEKLVESTILALSESLTIIEVSIIGNYLEVIELGLIKFIMPEISTGNLEIETDDLLDSISSKLKADLVLKKLTPDKAPELPNTPKVHRKIGAGISQTTTTTSVDLATLTRDIAKPFLNGISLNTNVRTALHTSLSAPVSGTTRSVTTPRTIHSHRDRSEAHTKSAEHTSDDSSSNPKERFQAFRRSQSPSASAFTTKAARSPYGPKASRGRNISHGSSSPNLSASPTASTTPESDTDNPISPRKTTRKERSDLHPATSVIPPIRLTLSACEQPAIIDPDTVQTKSFVNKLDSLPARTKEQRK